VSGYRRSGTPTQFAVPHARLEDETLTKRNARFERGEMKLVMIAVEPRVCAEDCGERRGGELHFENVGVQDNLFSRNSVSIS
jgi:hypothetical protein